MIAYAVSAALFFSWVRYSGDIDITILIASGLFAIAGAISTGLGNIANKKD